MPPIPAATRRMRLCAGLTVVGGMLVIAGLATGLVGETSRLAGGRGWHPIVVVAEILVVGGMACGAGLFVAFAAWRVSAKWRRQPPVDAARAPPVHMAGRKSQVNRLRQSWRSAAVAEPWPVDSADFSHLDPADGTARIARPQPTREAAHRAVAPDRTEREAAPRAPAQQKMTQIKDLYREAEQMGDAEFSAHWEDLRKRQHELIRQYFEQTGLGSADVGQGAS